MKAIKDMMSLTNEEWFNMNCFNLHPIARNRFVKILDEIEELEEVSEEVQYLLDSKDERISELENQLYKLEKGLEK
ncbi:MAG: hypothetical protein JKY52_09685 [Flavobacteriales bacterium]|nr:hypothetical protein [Flavobacteriales bacterium]